MKIGLHLSYQNLHGMPDAEFFRQEQDALHPFIPGLFDNLIDS